MLNELGEFTGNIIILLYTITILNYIVKFINRNYRKQLMEKEKIFKIFKFFMKIIVKNHKLFGILTVVFLLIHFFMQFNKFGISVTGLIAAVIIILQMIVGIYGSLTKKTGDVWLFLHRFIATILLIAIAIHIA